MTNYISDKDIKKICRKYYNLRGNVKIHKLNMKNNTFTIRIGDCFADIPIPKVINRILIIEKIINNQ